MGIGAGIAGIAWGVWWYRKGFQGRARRDWADWRRSAGEQFGYDATVMDAGVEGGGAIAKLAWWFDANVVDGIVNAVGFATTRSAGC